jgi:hypothetical protein
MVEINDSVRFSGAPINDGKLINDKTDVDHFSNLINFKNEIDKTLNDPNLSSQEKLKKILNIRGQINAILKDSNQHLDPEMISKYAALLEETLSRVQQFVPIDIKPPLPRPMGL